MIAPTLIATTRRPAFAITLLRTPSIARRFHVVPHHKSLRALLQNDTVLVARTWTEKEDQRYNNHKNGHSSFRNGIRLFSSSSDHPSPAKAAKEGPKEASSSDIEKDNHGHGGSAVSKALSSVMLPQVQFYGLVSGGVIGAYGLSRVVLSFTGFFTHLTPTVIAKWGFYTGFGCAGVVGGLALMTADNLYIRADPVYRYCLNWVVNDVGVQKTLGDGIKPGNLRSYRMDSGKLEMAGKTAVWRPPRIQMIFDVTATGPPYRTGIVTCEAVKAGGFPPKLTTTLLKLDYETGNEGKEGGTREGDETLFLKGDPEEFARVSRRSGLCLDVLARSVHIERAAAGRAAV